MADIGTGSYVERNEMRYQKAVATFVTTGATGTITLKDGIKLGAPDQVDYEPVTAGCATNEEQVSIASFDTATGIVTVQRDGTSTLTSAGVFNLLFTWYI